MESPLLKPRWLVGHLLVVAFSVVFVGLGLWQLDRHDSQRFDNTLIEQARSAPITDLNNYQGPTEGLLLQRVSATGFYDYGRQLERRPRTINGRIGFDAVTPLVSTSETILVNRGFIPDDDPPAANPTNPGELTVTGWLVKSQGTSSFGPQNPDKGDLSIIARIDISRLAPQFEEGLLPAYIDLISESPSAGGVPTVFPEPVSPTKRPNLLYAYQWFTFAVIASGGWVIYLRKQFFAKTK